MKNGIAFFALVFCMATCKEAKKKIAAAWRGEAHRPQLHFTPQTGWMNDPNGMVYYKGTYHLFYQYYPDSTVWGPMHWGHATSNDLIQWQQQPIALYPDSLGYIFSGSAVVDSANTSGFGASGKVPLVAIFTSHDTTGEKAGRSTFQTQSIAYSLDEGATWSKYAANPVLKNPGIRDFRDPKVMWHEETKKWIMTLATMDRVTFYSSPDLKNWQKQSEFGKAIGAHGGVWECPDLFPLDYNGEKIWVLLVSINPGGPNGGSATQYFTGTFDGQIFTPHATDTRWIDYGPDNYAGITWSNTGPRKIFMGWMSNWQYANVVPTESWRSAMTLPRDLSIEKIGGAYMLRSVPSPEVAAKAEAPAILNAEGHDSDITAKTGALAGPVRLQLKAATLANFSFILSNSKDEKLIIGYNRRDNNYFIDRSASGKKDFEKGFAQKHTAPRLTAKTDVDFTLIIDDASVELFADHGLTVMTSIFFPTTPYTTITMQGANELGKNSLQYTRLQRLQKPKPIALLQK